MVKKRGDFPPSLRTTFLRGGKKISNLRMGVSESQQSLVSKKRNSGTQNENTSQTLHITVSGNPTPVYCNTELHSFLVIVMTTKIVNNY